VNKLKEDVRVGILGAAAGLFSISISLMIARIDAFHAYLSRLDEIAIYVPYDRGVENLWWVPIAVWHLILSITAALLAHRHLTTRLSSPFLLWQVIGIASLLGWGLTVLLAVGMECLMSGNLYAVAHAINPREAASIAKYVSVAFASNVFYASVMKACFRQYTARFDELPSDPSSINHLLSES